MTDEEKKAIESLIEIREFANLSSYKDVRINQLNAIDEVLNLVEKQSKEIERINEILIWKQKHEEQLQKEIEELKDFIVKLQATKDRLDNYDKENTLEIEKLKKEIEELKQDRDEYKEEYIKLQNARYYNYISKDKIKARIEELEEYLYKGNIKDDFLMIRIKAKIQELQSLLEKE